MVLPPFSIFKFPEKIQFLTDINKYTETDDTDRLYSSGIIKQCSLTD
jgi:hypothetical protein